MRIGIDIRPLNTDKISGVGEYTANLVKNLLELDKKNQYVLFCNSFRSPLVNKQDFSGAEFFKTSYPNKLFNLSQKIFSWPKIDKAAGTLDFFIFPNLGFFSLSPSCPYIVSTHDLSGFRYPHFFSFKRQFWHRAIDYKKIIKNARYVVAVSQSTKDDILNHTNTKEEKVKLIYPGIKDIYQPLYCPIEKERQRKRLGLPKRFILYLGTIEPRKNLRNLIYAFERLKKNKEYCDTHLVLAGGYGWKYKQILEAARKSKWHSQIIFTGYIKEEDKRYYYNLCQAFVYPSYFEGFGFPPLEAILSGARVLASANSSLSEIGGPNFVLINPHKVENIAANLDLSLKNKKTTIDTKSIMQIQRGYNWRDTALKYLELLQ